MNHRVTQVWRTSDGETFEKEIAAQRHQLMLDAGNQIIAETGISAPEALRIMRKPHAVASILQEYLVAVAAHHAEAST